MLTFSFDTGGRRGAAVLDVAWHGVEGLVHTASAGQAGILGALIAVVARGRLDADADAIAAGLGCGASVAVIAGGHHGGILAADLGVAAGLGARIAIFAAGGPVLAALAGLAGIQRAGVAIVAIAGRLAGALAGTHAIRVAPGVGADQQSLVDAAHQRAAAHGQTAVREGRQRAGPQPRGAANFVASLPDLAACGVGAQQPGALRSAQFSGAGDGHAAVGRDSHAADQVVTHHFGRTLPDGRAALVQAQQPPGR